MKDIADEITFLKNALKNLWIMYSFEKEYVSFLRGECTEEQFQKVEDKLILEMDDILDDEYIRDASVYIYNVIKEPILTFELSKIIGIPEYRLKEALHKYGFKLTIEE